AFRRRCLQKAVDEINKSKTLGIYYEEIKEGRKVAKIKFSTSPPLALSEFSIEELRDLLGDFQFTPQEIKIMRDSYSDREIFINLKYTLAAKDVKNKKAYAMQAIREGYAQDEEQKTIEHQEESLKIKKGKSRAQVVKALKTKLEKQFSATQQLIAQGFWSELDEEQQQSYMRKFPKMSDLFGESDFLKMNIGNIFTDFYAELKTELPKTLEEFIKIETKLYEWNEEKEKMIKRKVK
ncbi:MAG: replication initiation protein, partial [Lentisphaeraceae bacterium]|nr:replication initiation protein [Lentisphaeraceae bacterium]